jgi:hypothetical protein
MISFNFQDTHYFESFKNCIVNVRKHYEHEIIDVFLDDNNPRIDKYNQFCEQYNCNVYFRERHMGFIYREDDIQTNLPKMLESHYRIYQTCKNSNEEWIMLLEDDVLIKRKIKYWPSADCGTNREWFKVGGGGILRRKKYIEIYEDLGESGFTEIINKNHLFSWAGDALKQTIYSKYNASSEKWVELAEPNYYDNTDHAVFHGYKELHKLG